MCCGKVNILIHRKRVRLCVQKVNPQVPWAPGIYQINIHQTIVGQLEIKWTENTLNKPAHCDR